MTATGHSIIGAFIASKIPDPTLGLTLSFVSHFVFDLVPHWDLGTNWTKRSKTKTVVYSLIDSMFGFTLGFILFPNANTGYLFLAITLSQLPDYLSAVSWFWGIKIHPFDWIAKEQMTVHLRANLPWGLITQIIVVLFFLSFRK